MSTASEIAQLILERGRIAGQGAANRGAIWGGELRDLGQTIGSIPAQMQQAKMQGQEMQLRQQEMGIRQAQLQQQQRQQAAEDALNNAYSKALKPDGSIDTDLLAQSLAGTLAASKWPTIQAGLTAMQEKGAQLQKLRGEIAAAERDQISSLGNSADAADTPENKAGVILTGLAAGVKDGSIAKEHALPLIQEIMGPDGNPDSEAVTRVIARMKQVSPSDVEKRAQAEKARIESANAAAQLPAIQARGAIEQQVAAGTQGGLTPEQQQAAADRQAALAQSGQNQALRRQQEQQRIGLEQRRVGLEQQRLTQTTNAPTVEIKPGSAEYKVAQDLAAGKMTFSQFRTLTAYGRDVGKKMAIYKAAADLNPEFNPTTYELGFKMASDPAIRQRLVAITSLNPALDMAEQLADQVGNGDVPAFNRLLQSAKFQLGNRQVTNFRQLQTLLGDEIGIALGVGTGSDLKTRLGLNLVDTTLSPQNFKATLEQTRQLLDVRRQNLLKTMGIYGEPGGPANPNPAPLSAPPTAPPPPQGQPGNRLGLTRPGR